MVSQESFRKMGYIYAGVGSISSLLLLINSSLLVEEKDSISIACLFFAIFSMTFDILLIVGIIWQRNQLVIVHLIWVAFSYVLLVITLFVYGVILGKRAATYELVQKSDFQGDLMMALTALHITSFALLSIFYAFIAWILNGVIGAYSETRKTIDAKNTNLYIE
uniref:(northern house mosquito) hypothetical protein n=1 Tax=Culex pipiens TaxID=7175 RepID=A0A8D8BBT3_CULPI